MRGADATPENTLAAFEAAHRQGAPAVELDVRLCASGEAVVFHDADLSRMTGGERRAAARDLSLAELRAVRLGGTAEGVPALDDVLGWAASAGVAVNVEVKHDDSPSWRKLVTTVAQTLKRHPRADVLLSSFHPALLAALAPLARGVPRAVLTHGEQGISADLAHAFASTSLCFAVHVERTQLDAVNFDRWLRKGLRVGVWTVNDAGEARDLVASGANYLITDVPAHIVPVVTATARFSVQLKRR